MDSWVFCREGFRPEDAALDGNRFLCANGYMGLRGVPEEAGRELFPAIPLAGVYDRFEDRWREPVNAPNCLLIRLSWNGQPLALPVWPARRHVSRIDYRRGVYARETDFGPAAVQDTFDRAFAEWKDSCVYLTELVMVLNHKLWQWYNSGRPDMAEMYNKLYGEADTYAQEHLTGEEADYYYRTTD